MGLYALFQEREENYLGLLNQTKGLTSRDFLKERERTQKSSPKSESSSSHLPLRPNIPCLIENFADT